MVFKSIYNFLPEKAVISDNSEVIRDESLSISQIISLHLRGISTNLHTYDEVEFENGYTGHYPNESNDNDYYELENDLSDYNFVVPSSGDFERMQANEQPGYNNGIPNSQQAIDDSPRGDEVSSSETSATL